MRRPVAWVVGGAALFGFLRRRRQPPPASTGADPRADDLRRKLEESRSIVQEREEFEVGETPVDQAEPVPADPAQRRREVHEDARATVEQMREAGR